MDRCSSVNYDVDFKEVICHNTNFYEQFEKHVITMTVLESWFRKINKQTSKLVLSAPFVK